MIHELRWYRVLPGKLGSLVERTGELTVKIFDRHGIKHIGFWTVMIGESHRDFIYLLEFESLADREKKWGAFLADQEWISKFVGYAEDITNTILVPTAYSALLKK